MSPHSSALLTHFFTKIINIPEIKIVNGGIPETTAVLNEKFDLIFYTGGSTVGKIILAAASKHLTPCILELGGKCPALIHSDADITTSAKRIMWAKTMNAGQVNNQKFTNYSRHVYLQITLCVRKKKLFFYTIK